MQQTEKLVVSGPADTSSHTARLREWHWRQTAASQPLWWPRLMWRSVQLHSYQRMWQWEQSATVSGACEQIGQRRRRLHSHDIAFHFRLVMQPVYVYNAYGLKQAAPNKCVEANQARAIAAKQRAHERAKGEEDWSVCNKGDRSEEYTRGPTHEIRI